MRRLRVRSYVGLRRAFLFASCVALNGCATMDAARGGGVYDPFEPMNRAVFDVNESLDRHVIEPIVRSYRDIVPAFARDRIRAFIDNLAEPRIFVNDMLQGRGDAAGITFARFFINTTAGAGGLFDAATEAGYPRQSGDFGQTLYAWGVDDGPYLVLLFFGPSNARDAIGLGVDLYTTPPAHLFGGHSGWTIGFVTGTVDGFDLRSRNLEAIDEIRKSALDLYAHFRSIARQHRASQLREAREEKAVPEELLDPGAAP